MSVKHSHASSTNPRQSVRINPTPTSNQIMERNNNTHKRTTTHQRSIRRGKKSSKRCVEFFCSSRERSMGDYSPLSALSRPNKQTQQREQWSYASNFWTSCHARKKQSSPIERATWFSQSTATRRTSPSRNPAAAQEDTCSWQDTTKIPSTTGQSSTSPK